MSLVISSPPFLLHLRGLVDHVTVASPPLRPRGSPRIDCGDGKRAIWGWIQLEAFCWVLLLPYVFSVSHLVQVCIIATPAQHRGNYCLLPVDYQLAGSCVPFHNRGMEVSFFLSFLLLLLLFFFFFSSVSRVRVRKRLTSRRLTGYWRGLNLTHPPAHTKLKTLLREGSNFFLVCNLQRALEIWYIMNIVMEFW